MPPTASPALTSADEKAWPARSEGAQAVNKTRPRSGSAPRGKASKKKSRRRSFYARNRNKVFLGALALVALGVFLLNRGGSEEGSASATAFTGGDFHSLVADPSKPGRIYAGGHQAVALSVNGGRTWEEVESLEGADAMGWGFTETAVFLAGHPGLNVSKDGGQAFGQANQGLPATDLHSFGAAGEVLYAGSPAGLLASTDGGASWQVRNRSASQSYMGRILVNPAEPDHLVAPDMSSGVVESRDGGRSWRSLGGLDGAAWVSWDPANPARIVATGGGRAVRTEDGGRTWTILELPSGASIVEVDPNDAQALYAGVHDGERVTVYVSKDGGGSWQRS